MHILTILHTGIATISLKTLYPGGIRTRVFWPLGGCNVHSAATPPGLDFFPLMLYTSFARHSTNFLPSYFYQPIWNVFAKYFVFRWVRVVDRQVPGGVAYFKHRISTDHIFYGYKSRHTLNEYAILYVDFYKDTYICIESANIGEKHWQNPSYPKQPKHFRMDSI
jgi:hypothetical protein